MKDLWRLPTVMELSILLESHKFIGFGYIWSSTVAKQYVTHVDKYWIASWSPQYKQSTYEKCYGSAELVSIYVKVSENTDILTWTRCHFGLTYQGAIDKLFTLNRIAKEKYTSKRARVCCG